MKFFGVLRKRSVFISMLVSFLLVFVIPVFICGIVYYQVEKIVEKEINSANTSLLKQLKDVIDGRLKEMEQLSTQIALSDRINAAITADSSAGSLTPFDYFKITEELNSFTYSRNFLSDYYVYLNTSGTVLSPHSRFDGQDYFKNYLLSSRTSFEEWKKLFDGRHNREFTTVYRRDNNGEPVKAVAYIQSLPLINPNKSYGTVVIMMDEATIRNSLQNIEWIKKGQIFILDKEDNIIASSNPDNAPQQVKYGMLEGRSGLQYERNNREKMAISHIQSDITDWKYITYVPESVFWEKVNYVKTLIFISLLFCFFIGILLIYFLLRMNYNPIKNAVRHVAKDTGEAYNKRESNELEYIAAAMNAVTVQKRELLHKVKSQQSVLQENFLLRLLHGRLDKDIPLQDLLSNYDLHFCSDHFTVVLFYIEDYKGLFTGDTVAGEDSRQKSVRFIIKNVVEELFNTDHQGYVVDIDEKMLACIVNLKGQPGGEPEQLIRSVLEQARKIFDEEFSIFCTASISHTHGHLQDLPMAYREAVDAMEYRLVMGKQSTIFFSQIQHRISGYQYDIRVEQQLLNFLKAGDPEKSKELIDEVFGSSELKTSASIEMVKCLMYDMASTFVKALEKIDDPFLGGMDPVKRLMACETVSDMQNELLDIIEKICMYEKNKKKSSQLSDEVIRYIHGNYQDMNLSVGMLGEIFHMAPSYLSKLFKEQTGEAVVDYINKVRIVRVKQLLEEGMNISDIAEKVGMVNSNALIRVFKKYEGITPGKFREI